MKIAPEKLKGRVSRRTFLAGSAGAGLIMGVGVVLPGCSREEAVGEIAQGAASRSFAPTVWFEIAADGGILVNVAKAEMGQHVGTALARVIADELGANWSDIRLNHVDTDPRWGYMVTGGSWSVFTTFAMLSQAGAAGRTVLRDAGAVLLDASPDECTVEDGRVKANGREVSFARIVQKGDISRTFSAEELAAMPLKPASERRFIGHEAQALDIPAKAGGGAVYGLDVELPDMLYAHPLIPPTRYGSSINGIDDTAARDVRGYQQTLVLDDPSGVLQGWAVVIAENFPSAMKAAKAVDVDWTPGPTANVGEADILGEGARLAADKSTGVLVVDDGDVTEAQTNAAKKYNAIYRTGTVLHFTLEPANAVVEFDGGKCHIHAGNQWQSLILPVLAKSLGMEETDIVIHQYYLGGGFGRRLWGDQIIPAALAARALGKPVKIVFQRADDSRFDCTRSASVQQFDASFDDDGKLTGIEHAAAAGWPTLSMAPGFLADGVDGNGKFDPFSISGADHWYTLPNHRVRAINNDLAQRTFLPGWLRSVGPGWVGWGVESFMDELAQLAGQDPIEFRLARLDAAGKNAGKLPESVGGATRLAGVLKDVRERSGWGRELPAGEGLGVAVCHGQERTMPTWIASVAHVTVDPDTRKVRVKKIWQSIDCGTVVHPDGALAQAEGAILWGVSLALHEGATFEDGQVSQRNLDAYTPLRMADVPELDIHFMESTEFPTGLGEPPLVSIPPAIGNAIFAASGIRARDLPIRI
ncbi:MAG: xanthine dehydrogenase family protein molybdopterin-binding subunit [Gammaproteobacteria bacterium]|nr:xanthine dehydrogenase family protein molybdopterin-binding subunit [Gammaproteobacteria bacterium]